MGTHLVAVDDFGVGVLFFFFLVASKSSIEIVETGISVEQVSMGKMWAMVPASS